MKNVTKLFIIIGICMSMSACKPIGMSSENYDLGVKAVDVIDQYLDGEITSMEALDKLHLIEYQIDTEDDNNTKLLKLYVGSASVAIAGSTSYNNNVERIKEAKEDINNCLNR